VRENCGERRDDLQALQEKEESRGANLFLPVSRTERGEKREVGEIWRVLGGRRISGPTPKRFFIYRGRAGRPRLPITPIKTFRSWKPGGGKFLMDFRLVEGGGNFILKRNALPLLAKGRSASGGAGVSPVNRFLLRDRVEVAYRKPSSILGGEPPQRVKKTPQSKKKALDKMKGILREGSYITKKKNSSYHKRIKVQYSEGSIEATECPQGGGGGVCLQGRGI